MESEIHLRGAGARSESLARMVAAGGVIKNRAMLIGGASGTNGFLGCTGLKLSEGEGIASVPAPRAVSPMRSCSSLSVSDGLEGREL